MTALHPEGRKKGGPVAVGAAGVALGLGLVLGIALFPFDEPGVPWSEPSHSAEGQISPRAAIHIVLQWEDCPEALEELDGLAAMAADEDVPVEGVLLDGATGPPPDGVAEALNLSFPVRREEGRRWTRFLRSLGFERTPAVLVVDPRGRLRSVTPGDWAHNLSREVLDDARRIGVVIE